MTTYHRFFPLLLLTAAFSGIVSCSWMENPYHATSKTISNPLLDNSTATMSAQPNGYALLKRADHGTQSAPGYLSKSDLRRMQEKLESFPAWSRIANESGVDTTQKVFSAASRQTLTMAFRSEQGRSWIEIWDYSPYHVPSYRITLLQIPQDRISEARRLISDTLKEMDELEQVERRLRQSR